MPTSSRCKRTPVDIRRQSRYVCVRNFSDIGRPRVWKSSSKPNTADSVRPKPAEPTAKILSPSADTPETAPTPGANTLDTAPTETRKGARDGRMPTRKLPKSLTDRMLFRTRRKLSAARHPDARAFEPGCKVDCLPVVVGPQGWNESRAIQALVPVPAWFSDDLSTALVDRDSKESLTGKWIIELAEFPHIRREIEKVKAFFSRQADRFRRAYDRTCAFAIWLAASAASERRAAVGVRCRESSA